MDLDGESELVTRLGGDTWVDWSGLISSGLHGQ